MTIIVKTNFGKVEGISKNGLKIFKGIPYAASPVDSLRLSPPEPVKPWEGILDATKFGPYAWQGFLIIEQMFGRPTRQSEADCLTLNIWTPALDGVKRPVMVWIHGGAFISGGGALPLYHGTELVKRGDVVIVTINYRLGALGFLYIPDKTANIGMLDQVAALKWVKENIESFGGNPDNITIFGESAGGMSVITLLAMPSAKGLFHHAISQSGPITYDPEVGKRYSEQFMAELGLKSGDIDALCKVSVEKIIKAQNKITSKASATGLLHFAPRIDKKILPKHPIKSLSEGFAKDVDFIVGSNLNEMKLFTVLDPKSKNIDENKVYEVVNKIMKYLGQDEQKTKSLIRIYNEAQKKIGSSTPNEILNTINTDFVFRIPAIRLAEVQSKFQPNTYNYLFTWPSPAFKGKLGSCHAVEIPFVFGTTKAPFMDMFCGKGAKVQKLSEKMMECWLAFARTGNPNNALIPEWPSYNSENRATMIFGEKIKIIEKIFEEQRQAWDNIIL